ncbi:unnamed protein product [Brassicogethes aeneus]|uniref:Guanine nucleotide-binding protein G(s) subunit alpha n=1 Tax=Brassicogethes aeneus TaxID=1431903 RepID=A0A9P0AWL9_BRAAE|nr:unnamed protein product [Brassicogethes aeneus]
MTLNMGEPGCIEGLLPCLYHPSPEAQRSAQIDKQIAGEKEDFQKTHRLLLLGAGESGKSTIIKQMQLIHVEKFSDEVRKERRNDIRHNLLDAIVSIITAISTLTPPILLEHSENTKSIDWILHNSARENFDFPQEFYDHVEILWKDKGIQTAFSRSNEYQLIDSAQYFLEKVQEVRKPEYLPSEQDILRCRILTKGIYELIFQVKKVKFQMIDVGGQRGERRKWFLCFNGVTAIIFVTACSSYDSVLREDPTKNRLVESLEIFRTVWNNKFLKNISVILFLNKQDIFKRKIMAGRSKLEEFFEDYRYYQVPPNSEFANEYQEVVRAKFFIRNLFQKISFSSGKSKEQKYHCCYPHFTCAIDTDNIKKVFEDCRDSIQRRYLTESDLL